MVQVLAKSGADILASLTPERCEMLHMAGCIPEEAGEVFGVIKKHVYYNKPLDRQKLVEELGDLEFYIEGLRQACNITREEVLEANINKLSKRYEGFRYSDAAAQQRADQQSV
jgi:NTP pyrophosphatase (non-canonical NTP hydrolase)